MVELKALKSYIFDSISMATSSDMYVLGHINILRFLDAVKRFAESLRRFQASSMTDGYMQEEARSKVKVNLKHKTCTE